MDKFFDFIERRKFGILVTFLLHMAIFLYLQIETYSVKAYYGDNEVYARLEQDEEVIELNPDQIEQPDAMQQQSGDVKNLTQSSSDTRQKSYENFSKTSVDSKVEASVRDLERQFLEEINSGKTDKKSGGEASKPKETTDKKTNKETDPNEVKGGDGIATSYGGNTMVRYELPNRTPHNGNDWYIRNPGYTCGSSSNGTVVVAIRVNPAGDVISARYIPEKSSGANGCMIEKAQEYALKSRFAYKSDAPKTQEGTITYNFVSKR
jgi:hypothetical protein